MVLALEHFLIITCIANFYLGVGIGFMICALEFSKRARHLYLRLA